MRRSVKGLLSATSMVAVVFASASTAQTNAPQSEPTVASAQSSGVAPIPDKATETDAQQSGQQDSTALNQDATPNAADIVVTARRQSESLQNVPQTVTAIGGDTIKKLNLTQFQDVASVTPGLTLNNGSVTGGRSPAPSIRGVTYDGSTQASPTVDIYLNEVPITAGDAFQAIYDIGGIEVLRGPQGTLRGRTAPSGAILISTRRANTNTIGGYVSALGTHKGTINGQAALNVPIVAGVAGLRVAGLIDETDADFVRSVGTGVSPYRKTSSGRASLTLTPSSNLDASVTYQYLATDSRLFTAVEGSGAVGGVTPLASAGYNGPALTASDRRGVDDAPREGANRSHQVTGSLNWEVLGHRLSYVGGYNRGRTNTFGALDYGNSLVGNSYYQNLRSRTETNSQEIRLSSTGDHLVDYTIGYFHYDQDSTTRGLQPASALAGAFGNPAQPDPRLFDPRYVLSVNLDIKGDQTENSFFGNVNINLGERTELSGGLRYIISSANDVQLVTLGGGLIAQRLPINCANAGFGSTYPGYCDIRIAPGTTPVQNATRNQTDRPLVYSATIRHRFSDDILAYANTGTSWRRGAVNVSLQNSANDPLLGSYTFLPNEKSTSYEVGLKTNWINRRLRLNLSAFYQKYDGLLFQLNGIPNVQTNGQSTFVSYGQLNVGADATVKGFDFDGAFQATDNWSLGLAVSYANGRVDDEPIPCNDSNFDGKADTGVATLANFQRAGTTLALCESSQAVSRDPIWNATLQSELHMPVGGSEGYVRGLFNYYPENKRANAGFVADNYGLLNLFVGLRSPDGGWDVGVFARNVTGTGVQLTRETNFLVPALATTNTVFGSSGYRYASYSRPREIGLSVRYAFGSR